jgi:predicted transcriptional regulator
MDEINRRAHLKKIDAQTNFKEVLAELKKANDKIEELNKIKEEQSQQIQDLTSQNKDLTSENSDLAETIQEKDDYLNDNSVRTLEYNCHSMFIH